MDEAAAPSSLLRSFERHLRALNRSGNTIQSYLDGARQAESFLASRGRTLTDARRADLEAFLAELLTRRSASTAYGVRQILRRRGPQAGLPSTPTSSAIPSPTDGSPKAVVKRI